MPICPPSMCLETSNGSSREAMAVLTVAVLAVAVGDDGRIRNTGRNAEACGQNDGIAVVTIRA
jgi:hypothetical protein